MGRYSVIDPIRGAIASYDSLGEAIARTPHGGHVFDLAAKMIVYRNG